MKKSQVVVLLTLVLGVLILSTQAQKQYIDTVNGADGQPVDYKCVLVKTERTAPKKRCSFKVDPAKSTDNKIWKAKTCCDVTVACEFNEDGTKSCYAVPTTNNCAVTGYRVVEKALKEVVRVCDNQGNCTLSGACTSSNDNDDDDEEVDDDDDTPTTPPSSPSEREGCRPIVLQLYKDYLERDGEESGVNSWVALCSKSVTPIAGMRDELAPGFTGSIEYRGIIQSIVASAFSTYLGRDADQVALDAWVNYGVALKVNLLSEARADIINNIKNSREAQCRPIVLQLYRDYLEREGETNGVLAWITACVQSKTAISGMRGELAPGFIGSIEFKNKVTQLVTQAYNSLLGREPDANGLSAWVNYAVTLKSNSLGDVRSQIQTQFTQSREYQCRQIIVAAYRTLLGREPDAGGYAGFLKYCAITKADSTIAQVQEELHGFIVSSPEYKGKN